MSFVVFSLANREKQVEGNKASELKEKKMLLVRIRKKPVDFLLSSPKYLRILIKLQCTIIQQQVSNKGSENSGSKDATWVIDLNSGCHFPYL